MKIYDAKPIDQSVLNELRFAIEKYENLIERPFTFREIRETHQILYEKLDTLISLRNKSIDEAIPDEEMENAFRLVESFELKVGFKVNYNPDVQNLIDKASKLSNEYMEIITR